MLDYKKTHAMAPNILKSSLENASFNIVFQVSLPQEVHDNSALKYCEYRDARSPCWMYFRNSALAAVALK